MSSNADNLLRNGFHSVETLGRPARDALIGDEFNGQIVVNREKSDEYESYNFGVATTPILVVPSDPSRTKLQFTNYGPDALFVGHLGQITSRSGYLLPSGQSLNTETTAQIYVVSQNPNGTVSYAGVWLERDNGEDN